LTRAGSVSNFTDDGKIASSGWQFQKGGEGMPEYEFACNNCKKEFKLVMSISEREKKREIECPSCKGKDVIQLVTSFMTKTSRKS
jgi:putative FmdB family regulatory protein